MFLFLGVNIDNIEYEVEVTLIDNLDITKSCVRNWWDVGRMLGIPDLTLDGVKQSEYNREGGSPTKCLLGILRTSGNVVSLKKIVETVHKLHRHDICKAIFDVYKSQETVV